MDKMFHMPMLVQIKPPNKRIRTCRSLRRAFRAVAKELFVARMEGYDRIIFRQAMEGFEVHHILPRMFGGQDYYNNLALCEPSLHKQIHQMIDRQIAGLQMGAPRRLYVPVLHGPVWGLTSSYVCNHPKIRPKDKDRIIQVLELMP